MGRLIDLTGQKHGRLKVLGRAGHRGRKTAWWCLCDCGTVKVITSYQITRKTKSGGCGCLRIESLVRRAKARKVTDPVIIKQRLAQRKENQYFYVLRKKYKLIREAFYALLASQNNACAICKTGFIKTPHVDHDHSCCPGKYGCGKCVRGLLCGPCNALIGLAKDSSIVLRAGAEYLERNKCLQNSTKPLAWSSTMKGALPNSKMIPEELQTLGSVSEPILN